MDSRKPSAPKGPVSTEQLLRGIHVFAGLKEETIVLMKEICSPRRTSPDEVVAKEGVPGRELFLIARGRFGIVKGHATPKASSLAILDVGDFVGEMSVIECMNRSASIVSLETGLLFCMECNDLLELFHKAPDQYSVLMLNIARDLCRRLRAMDEVFAARAH